MIPHGLTRLSVRPALRLECYRISADPRLAGLEGSADAREGFRRPDRGCMNHMSTRRLISIVMPQPGRGMVLILLPSLRDNLEVIVGALKISSPARIGRIGAVNTSFFFIKDADAGIS